MNDFFCDLGVKKLCVSIIITLLISVGSGLIGWTYSQVRDLPYNYFPRTELSVLLDKTTLDLRGLTQEAKEETRREIQRTREDMRSVNERLDTIIRLLLQKSVMKDTTSFNQAKGE